MAPCKAIEMQIFFIEHFENFLGVTMIFCKDNSLAYFLTVINFNSVSHQYVQNFFNGILIENPVVRCCRLNNTRF